jgi:hypothetical protein
LDSIHGATLDPYLIRWRAILAAYPYPITGFASKLVAYDEVPEELLKNARAKISHSTDLGLVRARSHKGDLWVLLLSEHFSEIGPIPRDPAVGEKITLLGAQFTLADPYGAQYNPKPGSQFVLSMPGEWLVEVSEYGKRVALFPLFVGVQPHLEPPILPLSEKPADLGEGAILLLNQARLWGGLESVKLDTGLASVARARLRALVAGELVPAPEVSLKAAGFGDSAMGGADCQARTLTDCLDGLWWSVENRRLFSEDFRWVGAAVEGEEGKDVRIMLMLAG